MDKVARRQAIPGDGAGFVKLLKEEPYVDGNRNLAQGAKREIPLLAFIVFLVFALGDPIVEQKKKSREKKRKKKEQARLEGGSLGNDKGKWA